AWNRTLRRPFLMLPQLRGPHDKPIKASTVVRMLAAAPPRPDTTPRNGADQSPTMHQPHESTVDGVSQWSPYGPTHATTSNPLTARAARLAGRAASRTAAPAQ